MKMGVEYKRLTKKDGFNYIVRNSLCDGNEDLANASIINKLGKLEDIEEELEIRLISLFDSKYTSTMFEMELETDDKKIYFDGDSFYGHYTSEQFLELIKDMLSMYKQLVKIEKEELENELN